jgi:hypothetical protein
MIKSMRVKWAGHVARMGGRRRGRSKRRRRRRRIMHTGFWWESHKVRDHWEDQDAGGWTILKWILER